MKFAIDPEFRDRLIGLTSEEKRKEQRSRLSVSIEEEGCRPGSLVVANINGKHFLADGHTCRDICIEKRIPVPEPVVLKFSNREQVLEWIDKNQVARRNLGDAAEAEVSARMAQAIALRINGQSTRAIAEELGVSQTTVRSDLAKATEQGGCSVEPPDGKVTGLDGKKRDASTSLFCDRCKRTGPSKDCPKCAAIQEKAGRKPKAKPAPKPPKSGSEIFDWKGFETHLGHVCRGPDAVKKAYAGKNFPGEGQSQEYADCMKALDQFTETWSKWRKRLQKVKE